VINPATNAVTATINVGGNPIGVAVSPTGPEAGDIYVANGASDTVSVINPATNAVTSTINVGTEPW
jgi:YVTN family beta-propeller protein